MKWPVKLLEASIYNEITVYSVFLGSFEGIPVGNICKSKTLKHAINSGTTQLDHFNKINFHKLHAGRGSD